MSASIQKITFGEMRDMGVRGVLIYRAGRPCSRLFGFSLRRAISGFHLRGLAITRPDQLFLELRLFVDRQRRLLTSGRLVLYSGVGGFSCARRAAAKRQAQQRCRSQRPGPSISQHQQ
jgi:hypothetical protein